jgi:hypothetical protein
MGEEGMTMYGASEDVGNAIPPLLRASAADGTYRQDDAPPHDETVRGASSGDATPVPPPTRSREEVLAAMRTTPQEFARLIQGQSDEALAQPASDGEWGVVEILPHLRDWEEVYLGWIHRLLDEETPALHEVDDSLWAIEHDYANEHVPDALNAFQRFREETAGLLEASDDAAWRREAIHPSLGPLTLHQLAERMCDHDARHIEQARDALS